MSHQPWRAVLAQTAMELRLTLRRGESVLVTLIVPLVLLFFFSSADLFGLGAARGAFLAPGLMALAIMSTGLVSLGIATAYERHYGVLKRLGGTPLTSGALVTAKLLAVLAVEAVQLVLIGVSAAALLGWRPIVSPLSLLVVLLGTAAFAGLGLTLAGTLRAEAMLAVANGLYVVLLLCGGFIVPVVASPPVLAAVAPWLPAAPLAEALRAALADQPVSPATLAVLGGWAVAGVVLATRFFRWE